MEENSVRGYEGKIHWKAEDFKSCIQFDFVKGSMSISINTWGDNEEEIKSLFDHAWEKFKEVNENTR